MQAQRLETLLMEYRAIFAHQVFIVLLMVQDQSHALWAHTIPSPAEDK